MSMLDLQYLQLGELLSRDRALGFESSKDEMKEIIETIDPEDEGWAAYENFLEVAALKIKCLFHW